MKNSKIIIALVLLVSISQFTLAQSTNDSSKFKFGIKGGANFSNISTNDTDKNKVVTGLNLGIFAKVPVTKSFAIQPEIYFTTKGSELSYNNVFVDGTGKFELNYIEVPLLMVFNLTPIINFQLGPYASYLVSSKVKNISDVNFNFENNIDSGNFNKFDTGIAVGLGVDAKSLGFGVRYNLGLVTVGKDKTYFGTNYVFPNGKNGVINLYLSYSIL